jgi:lysozyme
MAKAPVPREKPRLSSTELRQRIAPFDIDRSKYPLVVVGIRGYYKNSLGAPGVNDRGIYDDALFIDTSQVTAAFNGNTDPSSVHRGHGRGSGKGMACLNAGAWFAHQFGLHRGKYLALCQTGGDVTVTRDGDPDYEDTGRFGINIHRGSFNGTSSLGCQTVHPTQWDSFITLARDQAMRFSPGNAWKRRVVPYVLLEE